MRNKNVTAMALCGLLAAVAIAIMSFGGLIPFATYVCPILCALICHFVRVQCGLKWSITWYVAVSLLSLLIAPDREAAVVFLLFGYYPCIKVYFDRLPLAWLWKFAFFNFIAFTIYWVSAFILGVSEIISEFQQLGKIGILVILVLVNITLFMLDYLLSRKRKKR